MMFDNHGRLRFMREFGVGLAAVEIVDAEFVVIADTFSECAAELWIESSGHFYGKGILVRRISVRVILFCVIVES